MCTLCVNQTHDHVKLLQGQMNVLYVLIASQVCANIITCKVQEMCLSKLIVYFSLIVYRCVLKVIALSSFQWTNLWWTTYITIPSLLVHICVWACGNSVVSAIVL